MLEYENITFNYKISQNSTKFQHLIPPMPQGIRGIFLLKRNKKIGGDSVMNWDEIWEWLRFIIGLQ